MTATTSSSPDAVLFPDEKPLPILPAAEHYAGSEKLMLKSFAMQDELGPVFDVTCDCEDGAAAGTEKEHAHLVARVINSEHNHFGRAGTRIHDFQHPSFTDDIDILIGEAGDRLAYITLPKSPNYASALAAVEYIHKRTQAMGVQRTIPLHLMIESPTAVHDVWKIAALPGCEVIDFGLMDFVSSYQGAIPSTGMQSPMQFTHPLIVRAKGAIGTAAAAHGVIASHNVTRDVKNPATAGSDAKRAKEEFGFLRMWSIYPTQIQSIVDAMKPDYSEVQDAANILLAAQAGDWGPIQYAGELHDRATYRYFWEILQKARVTGVTISEEAAKVFFA
ncbi:MAG: CoA ester lyase [Betaproteobacteria bacterium]|nr:CoA ester lyase [Betaproteobacteria bacterium]